MLSQNEVESFAKTVWPHVSRVSIDPIVPGRRKPNEFEPLENGFTLTAYDAAGAIVKRLSAESLKSMKEKIEKQLKKGKAIGAVKM